MAQFKMFLVQVMKLPSLNFTQELGNQCEKWSEKSYIFIAHGLNFLSIMFSLRFANQYDKLGNQCYKWFDKSHNFFMVHGPIF